MRSTKSIILIVIALGCGLIASIGISQVMEGRSNTGVVETESIYVAATNVPSWTPISSALVQIEDWPKDKIPNGAARTIEEFEGMRPKVPLYPGEPIMVSKLSDGNSGSPSERIPDGHQVFSVKVDKESAISGLIFPGDKVDVLCYIKVTAGFGGAASEHLTKTRTILRNVSIFAVNDQIGRNSDEEGARIDAKTVSLLVTPTQSERLLLAKQLGTIHLALRKPGDETKIETEGATYADLNDPEHGSDGMELPEDEKKGSNGIIDLLNEMKAGSNNAADTSSAGDAGTGSETVTVIMSPDGVLNSYTFDQPGQLPQELLKAPPFGGPTPGSPDSDSQDVSDSDGLNDDEGEGPSPDLDDDSATPSSAGL